MVIPYVSGVDPGRRRRCLLWYDAVAIPYLGGSVRRQPRRSVAARDADPGGGEIARDRSVFSMRSSAGAISCGFVRHEDGGDREEGS